MILDNWNIEKKNDILGTVIITTPRGASAVVSSISTNPANILYQMALDILLERENEWRYESE